jgi:hypothetical protein
MRSGHTRRRRSPVAARMALLLAALAACICAPSALGLDATAVDTTVVAGPAIVDPALAVVDPAPIVAPDPALTPAPAPDPTPAPVVAAPDPTPAPVVVAPDPTPVPVVVAPDPTPAPVVVAPAPAPVVVAPDPVPAPIVVAPAPDPPAPVVVAPPVVVDVPAIPAVTTQDPVLAPTVQQSTPPQTAPELGVIALPDPVPVLAPPVPLASAATPAGAFPMQAMQAARHDARGEPAPLPVTEVAEATPVAAPGLGLLPGGVGSTGSRIAGLLAFMMGFLPFAPPGGKLGIGPPPHLAVLMLGMLLALVAAFSYTLRDVRRREPRGFATLALRPG